jgi:hypothetical protein
LNSAILDGKDHIILCSSDDEELNGSLLVGEKSEGTSHFEVRKLPL